MLNTGHRSATMLAGDQPALSVDGVPVVVAAIRHEDGNRVVAFVEAQQPIVRDIGENQMPSGGEISRTFRPARTRPQLLQPGVRKDQPVEPGINDDMRIFVHSVGFRLSSAIP
jgi:hypothetical protein